MAATGYTPISLYYSTTAAAVPTSGNLVSGELAINITDGKLYYKNNSGVVTLLASISGGAAGGSNTQVQFNSSGTLAGSSGFIFDGTNLKFASGAGLFPNTSDTSDTGTLAIGGGGANSSTRGGIVELYGNENASPGVVDITSGNVANSYVRIQGRSSTSYVRFDINATEQMRLDATGLGVGTNAPTTKIQATIASATAYTTSSDANILTVQNTTASGYAGIRFLSEPSAGNSGIAAINSFAPATGDSILAFSTRQAATLGERFRLGPSGEIGLSGANYGTSGQVLTSQGSGSPPVWAAGGGGSTSIGLVRAIAINCILC